MGNIQDLLNLKDLLNRCFGFNKIDYKFGVDNMSKINCAVQIKCINQFQEELINISKKISNYSTPKDLVELERQKNIFINKTQDFFREGRKLNIGIVGQVKAGKSSFLNTLLFGGKEVLPKASTPKTATLTKIEYAEENRIEIEYYTKEEWLNIEANARVDLEDEIYKSAKEIIKMLDSRNIRPEQVFERGKDVIKFSSYDDLVNHLNDYVGENGKYTPLVKDVSLFLNNEEFQGISIVDTPGLNDTIVSRTEKTREFLEYCDVVFFLSRATCFLDTSDTELLFSQLPQKGTKKLVLIASQYDSAVRDILRKIDLQDEFATSSANTENFTDNVSDACTIIQKKLNNRAKEKTEELIIEARKKGYPDSFIKVIQDCAAPIMTSAIVCNMIGRNIESYTAEEKNVYEAIYPFSKNIKTDLSILGNFKAVRNIYIGVRQQKEKTLEEKARAFIPTAKLELSEKLNNFKAKANSNLQLLKTNDKEELEEQKINASKQINSTKADIMDVFEEWVVNIKAEQNRILKEVSTIISECSTIDEKMGTRTRVYSYKVSDFTWRHPIDTWNASHREYSYYEEHYSYLDVSDAVRNMTKFSTSATSDIKDMFFKVMDPKVLKRSLLNVVVNNLNTGDQNFDSGFYRIMVQQLINKLEIPSFELDISDKTNVIATKFSGEVTGGSEKISLQRMLADAISEIYKELSQELDKEVVHIMDSLNVLKDNFVQNILKDINEEYEEILKKYADKETEIQKLEKYIAILDEEIKGLRKVD